MRRRHPLPAEWLMTDDRMGGDLWRALERVPRGGGVVVRHYGLPMRERKAVLARVERVARRRGLTVVGAGGLVASGGVHNRRARRGVTTWSAHDRREIVTGVRAGADLVFVSPVFATRSHPGGQRLGRVRLGLLIRGARVPVIALGGMDARAARGLRGLGAYGWAGIDAWMG